MWNFGKVDGRVNYDARAWTPQLTREEVIGLSTIVLTCWLWMIQHGGVRAEWAFLWSLRFIISLTLWGRIVVVLVGVEKWVPRTVPLTLVVGVVFLSSVLTACRMLVGLPISTMAELLLIVSIVLAVLFRRRISQWKCAAADGRESLWVVILCCLASTAWTRYFRPSHVEVGDLVLFKFIRDYFFHTQAITLLGWDTTQSEPGIFGLAGTSYPLYHYSGYALPAWGHASTGMASLDECFGFYLPFTFLMVGLTGGLLASEWFGWRAAIVVTIGLSILPDPTLLGIVFRRDPDFSLYSFQRFIQYAPANGYGFVGAGLALYFLSVYFRKGYLRLAVLAHVILAISLFFKAQVFVAGVLLFGILDLFYLRRLPWRDFVRRKSFLLGSIAVLMGLVVGAFIFYSRLALSERAPPITLAWPIGFEFSEFLLWHSRGDGSANWIARNAVENPGILGVLWRVVLLLFLPFRLAGSLLIIAAICCAVHLSMKPVSIPRRTLPTGVVVGTIVVYLAMALLIGPDRPGYAWGHPWNYQHVPFGWMYFIVFIWSIGTLTRAFVRPWMSANRLGAIGCILLAPANLIGAQLLPDPGLTDSEWNNFTVPRGLVDCANFIRENSAVTDLIQDSDNDGHLVVEAIAERRAYVGWPVVTTYTTKTSVNDIFEARVARNEQFKKASAGQMVKEFITDSGIRWYVLSPTSDVHWRNKIKRSVVFDSRGFQVIDLTRLADDLEQ